MSKNDKYKVEMKRPGSYSICCEGQEVVLGNVLDPHHGIGKTHTLSFYDSGIAEDFCYMLNHAFKLRMQHEQVEREQDRKECQTHAFDLDTHTCMECGAYQPGFEPTYEVE